MRESAMRFRFRDAAEVAGGAALMGFPVAVTEEVWNLGTELDLPHILYFATGSLAFLSIYIYYLHNDPASDAARRIGWGFWIRVLSTYGLTVLVSAMLLLGVDRLVLFSDPILGLKRTLLVAFPASFAATTVDSFASD